MAIWCLSGGISFADTFDLTDELQNSLIDRTLALETDLDEIRGSFDDGTVPFSYLSPDVSRTTASPSHFPPSFDLPLKVALRSVQEVLQVFRI